MSENTITIGQMAAAINVSVNSLRTLRQRGSWVAWDGGSDGDETDLGWRRYGVMDVVLTAVMFEFVDGGVSAKEASRIVNSARGSAISATHPPRPSENDVWIGRLGLDEGAAHVGGPLPELMADITRHISRDIHNFEGGGASILLVNVSRHLRRVRAALDLDVKG